MNINSAMKKLSKFKSVTDKDGKLCFYSRKESNRIVKIVSEMALPIVIERDGNERVSFHPTTIKSLVLFLENNHN